MEIKTYSELSADMKSKVMGWTNSLNRGNAIPIDDSSIHASYEAAVKYINEAKTAYEGQIIAVKEATGQAVYVVDTTATDGLRKLASGGDASSLERALNNEISARKDNDEYLSSEISTLQETTLPNLSSTLNQNLSIDVTVEAGTEDGVLSTYTISQGGVAKAVKINIPKDKVVEKAEVVKDPAGKDPGTYIKLTIANVADPIFVPVPELVNTYAGVNSDTVNLYVYQDELSAYKISADVKAGSIGAEHLTTELSTIINNVITSDADVRATVEALSGDGENSVAKKIENLSSEILSTGGKLDKAIEGLSSTVSAEIDADVGALSTSLSTTVDAIVDAIDDDVSFLSDAISSKVMIDGESASTLSIIHVSQAEYHEIVKSEAGADPHTLYIVSSLTQDMYGEKIVNLADGTDLSDAVNVKQLSSVSAVLMTEIESAVEGGVEELSGTLLSTGGIIDQLKGSVASVSGDTSIAGAKKYTDQKVTDAKDELKGTDSDLSSASTIAGAKKYAEVYADTAVAEVKTALEGTETDLSTAATIAGAKKYTDEKVAEVAAIANAALSDVSTNGTGVLTALTAENNEVVGTFKSLSGTYTTTGDVNAITSITQDDYGQITSVAGVHVLSAVELVKTDAAQLTGDLSVLANQYKIKVDGTELTTTIDIPKDKVIESASVVKNPEGQAEGTYIKIIVQNVADPIYVAVPTLVNTYAGVDSDTISMTVTDGTTDGYKISAEVVDGSITTDKLADEAVTPAKMSTLSSDIFIFDCGNAEVAD